MTFLGGRGSVCALRKSAERGAFFVRNDIPTPVRISSPHPKFHIRASEAGLQPTFVCRPPPYSGTCVSTSARVFLSSCRPFSSCAGLQYRMAILGSGDFVSLNYHRLVICVGSDSNLDSFVLFRKWGVEPPPLSLPPCPKNILHLTKYIFRCSAKQNTLGSQFNALTGSVLRSLPF